MRLTALADAALDRSVVLGYTKLGSQLRRLWWPDDPDAQSLAGKRVVVTGATSGIGEAMARSFAELGATVHVLGRNPDRVKQSVGRIRAEVAGAVVIDEVCDVSDLDAVRAWTDDLGTRVPALHGLVHNAGAIPPQREESAQGHEQQLAAHVLGPHLMTQRLLPLLDAAGGASVVWMSSGGMYLAPLVYDDLEYTSGYSGLRGYARTKRMQVVLADAWARKLASSRRQPRDEARGARRSDSGTDIRVESMHPGWAETPGVTESLPLFDTLMRPLLRDAAGGADTAVWLVATRPGSTPGHFWHDRAQRPTTFGWERGEDPARVALFLAQVSEMTGTANDWTELAD
jgi:dehydrogenase/reductase SDR family member 12